MRKPKEPFAACLRFVVPVVLALPVFGTPSAQAQVQPLISYVLPGGGQRGTTVQVGVRGRFLIGATGVYISGEGVKGEVVAVEEPDKGKRVPQRLDAANYPHLARLAITIAPDAEVGERDLRVVSPGGVSNRFRFYVGDAPEMTEPDESEKLLQEPLVLESLPAVANGQIFQADSDVYRFEATAGQTLVFDVDAQRIIPYIADGVPGWFQASLRLNDAHGNQLAYVDDFRHQPDPLLVYKFEQDGEYLVEVKDVLYRGRSDFVYRLSIGQRPYITHIFPLGARRGSETEIELWGVHLPQNKIKVAVPADSPAMRWVGGLTNNGLTSNVVRFAADDFPETFEAEPNNALAGANRIEAPVIVNGRIGTSTDVDHFVLAAKARQTLKVEAFARRLDSPLDSLVTVFDATGRSLQSNDDTIDESAGHVTHHADSYLTYTFPADGDYVVQIVDAQGFGGDEYAYRLVVAPPKPDYLLRIRPDNLRAAQGSITFASVSAFRRDGFTGEINLSIKDLPPGFAAPDEVIPERQNFARLTITAPLDAPLGIVRPKIVGTAADQQAKMDYEAAEKAVKDAEAAAAKAKEAADKAAAAQATAEQNAATKRQQTEAAKKKLDELQAQQGTAEAALAAAAKAVADARGAKAGADKALADAKAATAQAQPAVAASEKAAQEAEAAAKAAGEDAAKSPEDKQKATDEAAAKRKVADDAKAARTQAQQKEQEAQSQAHAAAQTQTQAEAQHKAAQQALENFKKQVPAATTAFQAVDKAAKDADGPAASAKAAADKARSALTAGEQVIADKRKLADEAKGKLGQTIVHEADPCEEQMQAFYYMHNVPTQEFVLSVLERGPFALTLDLPPREVFKVPRSGRTELVVRASFKEGVEPGEITLRPTTIPREWQIEVPPIPAGQNQTSVKITVFGNMYTFPGQRGTLLISASMRTGNQTVQGFVPAIPYEVVAQLPQ